MNTQYSEPGREISLRTSFSKTTSQSSGPVAGYPSSYNAITIAPSYFRNLQTDLSKTLIPQRKTKLLDGTCSFHGVKMEVDVVEKLASFP